MGLLSESRSVYSGPVRRSLERGERLGLDNGKAIKGLGTQVGSIDEQVDVLESQIVTLQSQVSGLSSSVTTLQGQVSTLQGQVGGLTTAVTNQATAIGERALGMMAFRGLSFSGEIIPTAGSNLSGTLPCTTTSGHRYHIVLFLGAIYGGSLDVVVACQRWQHRHRRVDGRQHRRLVVVACRMGHRRLRRFGNFDAVVVARQDTPHVAATSASCFYIEHLGPTR